jgi:hypothetical protein
MKRSIHRSACAVLALFALSLTGTLTQCPWKGLVVEISDFETNRIQGLQLWRADERASQSVSEAGRIVFGDRLLQNGSEVLEYTMVSSQNQPLEVFNPAVIVHGQGEDGPVTLHFIFAPWSEPPGWVRATSFNAAGESELSAEAVFL